MRGTRIGERSSWSERPANPQRLAAVRVEHHDGGFVIGGEGDALWFQTIEAFEKRRCAVRRAELPQGAAAVARHALRRVAGHEQAAVRQKGEIRDTFAHALTLVWHTKPPTRPERECARGNYARPHDRDDVR